MGNVIAIASRKGELQQEWRKRERRNIQFFGILKSWTHKTRVTEDWLLIYYFSFHIRKDIGKWGKDQRENTRWFLEWSFVFVISQTNFGSGWEVSDQCRFVVIKSRSNICNSIQLNFEKETRPQGFVSFTLYDSSNVHQHYELGPVFTKSNVYSDMLDNKNM